MRRRAIPAALTLLLLAIVAVVPASAAEPPPPDIERLARVGKLWGVVRYLHPHVAYRDLDWDAALVAAIPRVRAAKTAEEYRTAVAGMLSALGDPVTRMAEAEPVASREAPPLPDEPSPLVRKLNGRLPGEEIVAVELAERLRFGDIRRIFQELGAAAPDLQKASAIVIDLRGGQAGAAAAYAGVLLQELSGTLVSRPCRAPAQRYLLHSGFMPHEGGTSGGYYSGFLTQFATSFEPKPGTAPRRVVFVLDSESVVPEIALALQSVGDARLVVQGRLDEGSLVAVRPVDLGEGLTALVRVSEVVAGSGWSGLRADVTVPDGADPLQAALDEARREWPASSAMPGAVSGAVSGAAQALPDAVFRPDRGYPGMTEPALEYRQLAAIRAWNAIHWFYPYLHLIGDWDAVLPEFLARMDGAKTGADYALTLAEMMTHVPDGHTNLWGHPALDERFGNAGVPFTTRWIEGAPVAVRVSDEARAAGIEPGDALLSVDGEAIEAGIERISRTVTASTPSALRGLSSRILLAGAAGSKAVLKVRKLDGSEREVVLVRDPKKTPPPVSGDVIRVLPGNLGYADLTRLAVGEVDKLFETVKGTRGLILDMRGYPQGTAWAIAPRLNTRRARIGAQFRRSQVSAFSVEESESGFYFAQPLPDLPPGKELYTAPTVMLIDDRAISQSEHSGLFFEAANGTKFIGSPTAGANGDVTQFPLPGGITVLFTGHDVRHADGRQLQRVGLIPDIPVEPTRAGVAAGRDELLEAAVRYFDTVAPLAAGGQP